MLQISHRFETYLKTLLREVSKRGVLSAGQAESDAGEQSRVELQ